MGKKVVDRTHCTPPELAAMWGVGPDKIIDLIRAGELVAVDISFRRLSRPRWRIALSEAERFLQARQSQPPAPKPPRKKKDTSVIQFYS